MTSTQNYDAESCSFCLTIHSRTRPSFCQCKHCFISLCLECISQHHNDILQEVLQLSHKCNELQELVLNKQNMIVEETNKTIEDTNSYFDSYIDELRDIQRRVTNDLQKIRQDAQVILYDANG